MEILHFLWAETRLGRSVKEWTSERLTVCGAMISRFVKKPVNAWIAHETNITFVTGVCHIRFLWMFQQIAQRSRKVGEGV